MGAVCVRISWMCSGGLCDLDRPVSYFSVIVSAYLGVRVVVTNALWNCVCSGGLGDGYMCMTLVICHPVFSVG